MKSFVDRLQELNEHLPLRTVPLEIKAFTPVQKRLNSERTQSTVNQQSAIEAWQREIYDRFDSSARAQSITDVALRL
jgi:hypothetical protein